MIRMIHPLMLGPRRQSSFRTKATVNPHSLRWSYSGANANRHLASLGCLAMCTLTPSGKRTVDPYHYCAVRLMQRTKLT